MPQLASVGGARASERLDPCLLQVAQQLQVVRRRLPVQVQRCTRESTAAQRLAAQLRQAGKHMLDASARLGDAPVASLLRFRKRLILAAFALDEHAPTRICEPRFALAVDVALVGQYGPAGAGIVRHVFEVIGVVFTRRADLELADQLAALVRVGRQLVAEVGFAVLLGSARFNVLLGFYAGTLESPKTGRSCLMGASNDDAIHSRCQRRELDGSALG